MVNGEWEDHELADQPQEADQTLVIATVGPGKIPEP